MEDMVAAGNTMVVPSQQARRTNKMLCMSCGVKQGLLHSLGRGSFSYRPRMAR